MLGIDVTFNLGPFYVTVCTYQNLKVITDSGIHPIMVGPTFIHSSKDQSNFGVLFNEIVKRKPSLATNLRYMELMESKLSPVLLQKPSLSLCI